MQEAVKFETVKYYKGDRIFMEGELGYCAYLVAEGAVSIFRIIDDQKVVLTKIGKSSIFGEMGVISRVPRSACAEAAEDSTLVKIDEQMLNGALAAGNSIIQALTLQLMAQLRSKDKLITTQVTANMFLSFCQIMDMIKTYHGVNFGYAKLCSHAVNVLAISHLEINSILKWLQDNELIDITQLKTKVITIKNPDKFMILVEDLEKAKPYPTQKQEREYVDVLEAGQLMGKSPQSVMQDLRSNLLPVDLLFFSRTMLVRWLDRRKPADVANADKAEKTEKTANPSK